MDAPAPPSCGHPGWTMENWIGVGIWIVLGAAIGLLMKVFVRLPDEPKSGHSLILAVLGAFGAVIGGMLGVGAFSFYEPTALSLGGMAGAVVLSVLMSWTYRWGTKAVTYCPESRTRRTSARSSSTSSGSHPSARARTTRPTPARRATGWWPRYVGRDSRPSSSRRPAIR